MDNDQKLDTVRECFAIFLGLFDKKILVDLFENKDSVTIMDGYTIKAKTQVVYMRYLAISFNESTCERVKRAYEHMDKIVDQYIKELEYGVETRIKELAKQNAEMSTELDTYKDNIFFDNQVGESELTKYKKSKSSSGWSSLFGKK